LDFTVYGFNRLRFWYKNGPSISQTPGATVPWKAKIGTSVTIGGGPCRMEDMDDAPVKTFTSTNTWQFFDAVFTTGFANEGWGVTICGMRAALSNCVPALVNYIAGGIQYKCTAAQALTAVTSLQWETNFSGALSNNKFDLEIAQVQVGQ
jgi:hypothetical protein